MRNSSGRRYNITAAAVLILAVLVSAAVLTSCDPLVKLGLKKIEVTFDANGGTITKAYAEGAEDAARVSEEYKAGRVLPKDVAERDLYEFTGWFTEPDGGEKISEVPEEPVTVYAHWESSVQDRSVKIDRVRTNSRSGFFKIYAAETKNRPRVTFRISEYVGQDIAFVDKNGNVVGKIDVNGSGADGQPVKEERNKTITAHLPNRSWMDRKVSTYRIKAFANDHVEESNTVKVTIRLAGQYRYFDRPVEGSMVWYGGAAEAPEGRAGIVVSTDSSYVYAVNAYGKNGAPAKYTGGKRRIYKWEKAFCMINMADVRTDMIFDIYNAYSSRFFPIAGKCMYSNNGGAGLSRYMSVSKQDAVHRNRKTGKRTFMVPVQWNFARQVALAQERARAAGKAIYVADTFRPMDSVNPVAQAVKDASLLAYGGTSAHNFGFAVDCGWQNVNAAGKPAGEPYVQNLQALDKRQAVSGPNGNRAESWWAGVHKLPQEWWHYGDTTLRSGYSDAAKRVGSLYVNQKKCASRKRSRLK